MLAACGGGGGDPAPTPSADPSPTGFDPVFSAIQSNVFSPTCAVSGCHLGGSAPWGLRLDATNSYGLLVGVVSGGSPPTLRVAPGDPVNSYIIHKLEGTAAVGARMPLNGTPLSTADIATIRQWISDGAIDDRATSANPIRVTSLSPPPDSALTASPTSIIAMFDRQLDASTVNNLTFILESSGGDGSFGETNDVAIMASQITSASMTATFDLGGMTLADETYRVRLLGDGGSMIMDIDANALDGEYSGTFPSGDGTQGGDFEATFTVAAPVLTPTLDFIQASVFSTTCSSSLCHSGTGTILPGVQDLTTADASFASLVGVSSIEQPGMLRVNPGNANASYLINKLEGTAAAPFNTQMPLNGIPLDQAVIDNIRLWIDNGAAR
jgi:hypothetical protein